jgi:hypothetical protein
MTYKRAALFLALGVFLAGIFTVCRSPAPPPQQQPPPPPEEEEVRQTIPTRIAQPAPPPQPEVPPRPVTRDILEVIGKSAYDLGDLQYFISSAITLERGKGMQIDIEIKDGEGRIQEINTRETIIIPKDTGGVLMADAGPSGNPRTLKICFDEVDEHTLSFRENPADNRFYLLFREDRNYGEFTEYGNESYRVNFNREIPYLYVRLDESIDDRPKTREVPGRFVRSRDLSPRTAPPAEVPAAAAETPPAETLIIVPGRAPAPQSPVEAPPPAEVPAQDAPALQELLEL